MKLILNLFLSIGVCGILGFYSGGPFILTLVLFYIFLCLTSSVILTVFMKGNFTVRLRKSIPIAFPLNALAFVSGYSVDAVCAL